MDNNLVLGLYTYKANTLDCVKDAAEVQNISTACSCANPCDGNVDTSNEIDVEYANWDPAQNSTPSVWFTTWPQKPLGYSYKTRAAPFMTGVRTLRGARCNYVDWKSTMIIYASWAVSSADVEAGVTCTEPPAACNPPDCFEHAVMNGDPTQDYVPQALQTPGINFWVHPSRSAPADGKQHEAIISSFTYQAAAPSAPTPATPTPAPPTPAVPTPAAPTPASPTPPPAPTPAGGCVQKWQLCSDTKKCCTGLKCVGNQCQ
jgi:hypothetical protein